VKHLLITVRRWVIVFLVVMTPVCLASKEDHDDLDQAQARELLSQGRIAPLSNIIEKAQKIHQGKLLEVELKQKSRRYIYEIELLDKNGIVWEMYFDAKTAELLKVEKED